jgi:putative ABC transport system permease protein
VLAPGFELLFPPQANMEQFPSLWFAARIPYDVANRNNVQWRVIGDSNLGSHADKPRPKPKLSPKKFAQENTIAGQPDSISLEPMKQHLVDEVSPRFLLSWVQSFFCFSLPARTWRTSC